MDISHKITNFVCMKTAEWINGSAFRMQKLSHVIVLTFISVIIINITGFFIFGIKPSIKHVSCLSLLADFAADFTFCLAFVQLSILFCHWCMKIILTQYSFGRILIFSAILLTIENGAAIGTRILFRYYYDLTNNQIFDIKGIFGYALVSILVCSYYACTVFLKRNRDLKAQSHRAEIELAERQQQILQLKYSTLKEQLSPHFLFNSLNTLAELTTSNPALAEHFTVSLAETYHYILQNADKDLINLSEEINYASTYFSLMKIRRGEHISLYISGKPQDNHLLPPASLQLLIENAIKHNGAFQDNPLKIKVSIEGERIVITNNKVPVTSCQSTGHGLSNLKNRVRLALGKDLIINESETHFSVIIPMTKTNI